MNQTVMVDVQNLYHDYEGKGQYAVRDVSFSIAQGEIFGFLGPSGAGKSTVQNLIIGLLPVQQGQILFQEQPIRELRSVFFNRIGVSFEHPNLYGKLTGYENLKYYAGMFSVPTEDPSKLLDMVGLQDAMHKRAANYSKGMKQRLVFARALLNDPEFLFLDEPTAGLDPNLASTIKEIIRRKRDQGKTVFLTTHNMYIADELCDRVAFINDGQIVAMDTPRNLKLQYGERSVRVEYRENGAGSSELKSAVLSLESEPDRARFNLILNENEVQTIHSQEATLEQTFIKITGRRLT
ncbi:MAG TPA: ABC transporter ATP-binding protein [Candidatus Sulfomarinibacteraceae bacterium]|nr:ABC transporter ATP-binding protein [Candidatus Sulfomarinibacteraceae bacterium]